jgi:xanthine dehydrogenase accessory factor
MAALGYFREDFVMATSENRCTPTLVRSAGDVGAAVAVLLFRAGYGVALHDDPAPATSRRGMAFTDAVFGGEAVLDGITAKRIDQSAALSDALQAREIVPVTIIPFADVLQIAPWSVLIDARMRERAVPENQRGLAPLVIGLGPNFVAGENVDLAIETSWGDRLGTIIKAGATLPLAGEPRAVGGISRARFIYAAVAGCFRTAARIGSHVEAGEVVATIGAVPLTAPLSGVIRGLTHSGVPVAVGTKIIEVDPRGDPAAVFSLGERPRRIAEGVRRAVAESRFALT